MKISNFCLLICLTILLTACGQGTDPATLPTTTAPATTAAPTTTPPDTTPAYNTDWSVDWESMSYEEYFSRTRTYASSLCAGSPSWTVSIGDEERVYWLRNHDASLSHPEGGLYIELDDAAVWHVPNSEPFLDAAYSFLHADGKWGYALRNEQEFLRVNLLTGEIESLFISDRIVQNSHITDYNWYFCDRDVMYFVAHKDGELGIYRMYLPSKTLDVLYSIPSPGTADALFYLYNPQNTNTLYWEMMNPALMPHIQQMLDTQTTPDIDLFEPDETVWRELKNYETAYFTIAGSAAFAVQETAYIPGMLRCRFDVDTQAYRQWLEKIDYRSFMGSGMLNPPAADVVTDVDLSDFTADQLVYVDTEVSTSRPLQWSSPNRHYDLNPFVPHIFPFSEDAMAAQQDINQKLSLIISDINGAYISKLASWNALDYTVFRQGQILSLVITANPGYGSDWYYIYNLDLETGKRLTSATDFAKLLGCSQKAATKAISKQVEAMFVAKNGTLENSPDTDEWKQCLKNTMSPENLEQCQLYYDKEGHLMLWAIIYAWAGADCSGQIAEFDLP